LEFLLSFSLWELTVLVIVFLGIPYSLLVCLLISVIGSKRI
jgi:hypothetical protein